jgi:uncharacterized protein YlbG (UPF0298 family)
MTMKTVSIRITEEEKNQLKKYGKISDSLREGMRLYLNKKKSDELLRKLEKLQSQNKTKTTIEQEVKLIKEDRER